MILKLSLLNIEATISLNMKNISKEDYLSVIYKSADDNGEIKANQIAEQLNISAAAVTDMLRKLSQEGYVNYKRYKGTKLTKSGEEYARSMVRRHRIWELFLHQVVGLPWDKVHDEAHNLEHSASDELINRMEEMLDYPEYDPHGDPIPDKNGKLPEGNSGIPLSTVDPGKKVKVNRVHDFDSSFLQYVSKIGIELNKEVIVVEAMEFDHSLLVEIDNKETSISSKVAANIFVTEVK
ncbi:MAG: DtxR family transcriptional regulator [Ignavibacteriaceae bacterium]|nr:DtxR family transcriptional regulator [Ignavibacteriaceae bacterium]